MQGQPLRSKQIQQCDIARFIKDFCHEFEMAILQKPVFPEARRPFRVGTDHKERRHRGRTSVRLSKIEMTHGTNRQTRLRQMKQQSRLAITVNDQFLLSTLFNRKLAILSRSDTRFENLSWTDRLTVRQWQTKRFPFSERTQ